MSLKSAIISKVYAPKVKHRLPGRLRFNLPILKKVPSNREIISDKLEKLFLLPEGIDTVQLNQITGNILVMYSIDKIEEKSVLEWVETLWKMISEYYDRLATINIYEIDNVISKIMPILQEALNENHSFNKQIRLPDDIWP